MTNQQRRKEALVYLIEENFMRFVLLMPFIVLALTAIISAQLLDRLPWPVAIFLIILLYVTEMFLLWKLEAVGRMKRYFRRPFA